MIKDFVLFHIAIPHGHVAMKMVDSIWPKRENEQFFRFFNKDYQLMVGAAKIFSVSGKGKDAGVISFQHGLAA